MPTWSWDDVPGYQNVRLQRVELERLDPELKPVLEMWQATGARQHIDIVTLARWLNEVVVKHAPWVSIVEVAGEKPEDWPMKLIGSGHDPIWGGARRLGALRAESGLEQLMDCYGETARFACAVAGRVVWRTRDANFKFEQLLVPVKLDDLVHRIVVATSAIDVGGGKDDRPPRRHQGRGAQRQARQGSQ